MMSQLGSSSGGDSKSPDKRSGAMFEGQGSRESMHVGKRPSVRDVAKARTGGAPAQPAPVARRGVVPTFGADAATEDEVRMSTLVFLLDSDDAPATSHSPTSVAPPPTNESGVPLKAVGVRPGATDQILELAARSSTESRRTAKYFDPADGPRESMALGGRPSIRDLHPALQNLPESGGSSGRESLRSSHNSDSSL
jgi:hypothetical protein